MRGQAKIIRQLEAHKAKLARERDALGELKDEVEAAFEAAQDAINSLAYCIERLSELV